MSLQRCEGIRSNQKEKKKKEEEKKSDLCTFPDTGKRTTKTKSILKTFVYNNFGTKSLIQYKHDLLFYPEWTGKTLTTMKTSEKTANKRLLTLEEIKQTIVHKRGTTVLDYNPLINAMPKIGLDWIFANKYKQLNVKYS